jgi:hypothetical protein
MYISYLDSSNLDDIANYLHQVDTLIKYLVDSLQSFENGHGDALHPIPVEANKLFMGDHVAIETVTGVEFRQFGTAVNQKLDDFIAAVATCAPVPKTIAMSTPTPPTSFTLVTEPQLPVSCTGDGIVNLSTALLAVSSHQPLSPINESFTLLNPSSFMSLSSSSICSLRQISIPRLGRESGAWRRAVAQWEEIDPGTGIALRDWPSEWLRVYIYRLVLLSWAPANFSLR